MSNTHGMPLNIDTLTLKNFITICELGSFSEAADAVGRTQSAISLQIKKLEQTFGCQLFDRSKHKPILTEQGKTFLGYAKQIVHLQFEAYSLLHEPDIKGKIRLGAPEDFATHYLPAILSKFIKQHPNVQLSVACDLTLNLIAGFKKREYDIVLVKRDPNKVKGGKKVWREPLVWASAEHWQAEPSLSLVLSPSPCIYRARAIAALDRAKKKWHISYTSPSLAGTIAAVKAGLGMTVLPSNMLQPGISPARGKLKLPHLADAEIALFMQDGLPKACDVLAEHIIHSME